MWELNEKRPNRPNTLAPSNVVRWLERATAFEGIAPFYDYRVNLTGSGAPEEIVALDVTPAFFPTLGVTPLIGRFSPATKGRKATTRSPSSATVCGSAASPAIPLSSAARFRSMTVR